MYFSVMYYIVVKYIAVQFSVLQSIVVQFIAIECHTVYCSEVQIHAVFQCTYARESHIPRSSEQASHLWTSLFQVNSEAEMKCGPTGCDPV